MRLETQLIFLFKTEIDNDALREGYDMVISCLGFSFDPSLFNETVNFRYAGTKNVKKYPRITFQFESTEVPGVFYAGESRNDNKLR